MARNILKWLGKLAWGALWLLFSAVGISLISEGHTLPGVGLVFFSGCFLFPYACQLVGIAKQDVPNQRVEPSFTYGPSGEDFALFDATENAAFVAGVAASKGRIVSLPHKFEVSRHDDDCPFNDPFFNGDPGGMCSATTGDDRF